MTGHAFPDFRAAISVTGAILLYGIMVFWSRMAVRKMTFSLPQGLAARLTKRVAARDRSRYVAEAIAEKLAEREKRLIRACEIVNQDKDIRRIEKEFDSFNDPIAERWEGPPSR